MKQHLRSAARALDYSINDPARWSRRFQLLKRVYTIDSWDFQVDDAYTPKIGLTDTMLIDPEKSKFGVFFGDNTHYAAACEELAEMFDHAGQAASAANYRARAQEIRARLDALSWNGRFFTHFIDEDPTVKRNLGVDEKDADRARQRLLPQPGHRSRTLRGHHQDLPRSETTSAARFTR